MGLLKSIFKGVKSLAPMVADTFAPGSGRILQAGLGALSTIKKGDEQKANYAQNAEIERQNIEALEKRYQGNRGDAFAELQRMIDENQGINDDLVSQRNTYNDDVRTQRDTARGDIASLLNEIRGMETDISPVGDIERDRSMDAVLADRAAVRARQNDDANEATSLQQQMQTELRQSVPSADVLAGMIGRAGGRAITQSFEDSGNKAATELSRTGANGAKTFANLARERAEALKGNDINAVLAGLQGSEDLATSKAGRLSPMIAQMSARRTAQQDASAEAGASQLNTQRMMANKSNLLDVLRTNAAGRVSKAGTLAGLAPAMLAPSSMRLAGPQALQKSGGLNMSYMGGQVGQRTLQMPEDNTTSNLLETGANLAGMIGKKSSTTTPTPINARGMLRKVNASLGA